MEREWDEEREWEREDDTDRDILEQLLTKAVGSQFLFLLQSSGNNWL